MWMLTFKPLIGMLISECPQRLGIGLEGRKDLSKKRVKEYIVRQRQAGTRLQEPVRACITEDRQLPLQAATNSSTSLPQLLHAQILSGLIICRSCDCWHKLCGEVVYCFGVYNTPLTNNSERVSPFVALGFSFDSLCISVISLGSTLSPCCRLTLFKLVNKDHSMSLWSQLAWTHYVNHTSLELTEINLHLFPECWD